MLPHGIPDFPPFRQRRVRHAVRRGDLKYLILQVLSEKPTHGYDIMTVLNEKFGGFYFPSAGAIYPTLQMLDDVEYIHSMDEDGKKVYSITPTGIKFLEDNNEKLKKILERINRHFKTEKFKILRDLNRTAGLILHNYDDLTSDNLKEIMNILEETRKKIGAVILQ
jgi:DNA-binding PadR family transcriptional regulator